MQVFTFMLHLLGSGLEVAVKDRKSAADNGNVAAGSWAPLLESLLRSSVSLGLVRTTRGPTQVKK